MRGAAQRRSRRVRRAWNSVHGRRTTEFPSAAPKRQWTAGREPGGLSLRGVFVAGRRNLDLGLRGVDPMAIRTLKEMGDDVAHRQRGSGTTSCRCGRWGRRVPPSPRTLVESCQPWPVPCHVPVVLSLHGIVAKIEQCKRVQFTEVVRGASARSGSLPMKLNLELSLGWPHLNPVMKEAANRGAASLIWIAFSVLPPDRFPLQSVDG
jgi:hypothetical protein